MGGTWPKVIRDPVHGIVPFEDTKRDQLLLELINTREFQRLRRIKQLGMSEFVFPGANHSRFAHSIGVMHTARMFLKSLMEKESKGLSPETQAAILSAALLHDLGHGPFSHAFEKVTGQKHEKYTLEVIRNPKTEVNKRLRKFSKDLPKHVAAFFDEPVDDRKLKAAGIPKYVVQIVSSQLDADRSDYLLRDSHATGADYGKFDLPWLVHHLYPNPEKDKYYIGKKAFSTAEQYVFCRYHMYRSVYFHKTTRAAEVMLRLLFKRFAEVLKKGKILDVANRVAPGASPVLVKAFAKKSLTLDGYLGLDDFSINEFFKSAAVGKDKTMAALANGLLHRRLYKAVDVSDAGEASQKFFENAQEIAKSKQSEVGLAEDCLLEKDSIADTPYKPYEIDAEKPAEMIFVEDSAGRVQELSKYSKGVEGLKDRYVLLRYYFPLKLRKPMDKLASRLLKEVKS